MRIIHQLILGAILLAAASQGGVAANLAGTVRDSVSGTAIAGASVRVADTGAAAMTDVSGQYSFQGLSEGEHAIRASMVGYAPSDETVLVDGDTVFDLRLAPAPVELDEIVVTARGRAARLDDIPGSVAVVTDEAIRETNPVSIPEMLSREPGIAINSEMPWSSHAVIRGLSGDHVVMLVDGNRVVTANATAAQFGTVANGDIERIEVLKGPISVLYGSGSTGGVVNVLTRTGRFTDAPAMRWSLNPSYEGGSSGLSSYGRLEFSWPRLYVSVSQANRSHADYRASGGLRIANSQFSDSQTQVTLGLKITARSMFEARVQNFSASNVGIPGASSFPEHARASYPSTTRRLAEASLTTHPAVSWWEESRASVYHQPVERRVELWPNTVTATAGKPDASKTTRVTALDFYPEADHDVYGFRWQNTLSARGHTVVAGIEGWRKELTSTRVRNMRQDILDTATGDTLSTSFRTIRDTPVPDSRQSPVGLFAEDSFDLAGGLKITLGARLDRIHTENDPAYLTDSPKSDVLIWQGATDDDTNWSMVAGAIWNAGASTDLKLALARSFRAPTIEERYLYADLGKLTVGDPALDPEQGTFVEAGVSTRQGDFRLEAGAYLNSIDGMVVLSPGGTFNGRAADRYENAGQALIRGFELEGRWTPLPSFLMDAALSAVRGTDRVKGTDLPLMPPAQARLSANWMPGKSFWFSPALTLTDAQDRVAPGELRTAGYGIVDFTAGYEFTAGSARHQVSLGIKNLLDKRYADHLTVSRGYEMYGMGRSFHVSWNMMHE